MITSIGLKHLGFTDADFRLGELNGDVVIEQWNSDQPQPTVAEIEAADTEWHLQNDHKIARASAYPPIADQLDQIYHEGIDAWKETIAAVKAEYPKP
jgi:hypothetical protein